MLRYPIPRGSPAGKTSPVESSSREPRIGAPTRQVWGIWKRKGRRTDGGGDGVGTFLVENSSSLVRDFAVRPSR